MNIFALKWRARGKSIEFKTLGYGDARRMAERGEVGEEKE